MPNAWTSPKLVRKLFVNHYFFFTVINQKYEVNLEDVYTFEGNDALLKCAIPDAVKDFVSVTSWVKDGSLNIFPHGTGTWLYGKNKI